MCGYMCGMRSFVCFIHYPMEYLLYLLCGAKSIVWSPTAAALPDNMKQGARLSWTTLAIRGYPRTIREICLAWGIFFLQCVCSGRDTASVCWGMVSLGLADAPSLAHPSAIHCPRQFSPYSLYVAIFALCSYVHDFPCIWIYSLCRYFLIVQPYSSYLADADRCGYVDIFCKCFYDHVSFLQILSLGMHINVKNVFLFPKYLLLAM